MKWKILPLISLIFLSFIVFAKAEEVEPGVIVCTPESTDPFCMEIKTKEMLQTLYQTIAPGCTKTWKKTVIVDCSLGEPCWSNCEYWTKNTLCGSGVTRTLTCEHDLCVLQKYYKKSPNCAEPLVSEKTYKKGESITVTTKISCSSSSDWKISTYLFKEYDVSGTPSCPTGTTKRVFVGCENKQKIYDVYKISYVPRSCISTPYCQKTEEFLGKDYQDVECCVNEDCPTGYVCSNYKCVQVEVPTPPPEENVTVPPENVTMPPEENITKPTPPEEKPTETLSIIIWIIIFGAIGYFVYKRFKK